MSSFSGEAPFKNFGTDAIHAGQEPEKWDSRSVVPLIGLSTTFKQESPGVLRHDKYEYSRGGNPTRECLEECVAKIENGKHALAYASGLAATMSMVEALLEVRIKRFTTGKNNWFLLHKNFVTLLFYSNKLFGFNELNS